jgi:hypothetical protein
VEAIPRRAYRGPTVGTCADCDALIWLAARPCWAGLVTICTGCLRDRCAEAGAEVDTLAAIIDATVPGYAERLHQQPDRYLRCCEALGCA